MTDPDTAPDTTSDAVLEHVLDVAVVGGGQAGLAMGYHLRERGKKVAS